MKMKTKVKKQEKVRDYSLLGIESKRAIERGLANATWYSSPIPREKMKELLVRKDGPAIRDTLIWFGLIFGSGYLFYTLWGSWLAIFPYIVYSALYAGSSDSRWHESSHGTAFKTDWMNNVLYEIASFMVFRQSVSWKWSHARHHSDTIIRGRDPEIAVQRPADLFGIFMQHFALKSTPAEFTRMIKHAFGKIDPEVADYLPKSDFNKVFLRARIYLLIYASVIGLSIYYWTILPLMFIGIPTIAGSWLMLLYGTTQHAGLAENVLDHRLNSRTVYMNRVHRFLYWNMNYHIEHHMFPLVPYHALPKLHEVVKKDMPKPYKSIWDAYKEIIPALTRQAKDPEYYVKRELPATANTHIEYRSSICFVGNADKMNDGGWIEVCSVEELGADEALRFDFNDRTFAIYRNNKEEYYATDGICTHGNAHLADGLVIDNLIECPKHNGRFDITDGSAKRFPVCVGLKTYPVKTENFKIYLNVKSVQGKGIEEERLLNSYKVVSNEFVGTYMKELVLQPMQENFTFKPGEYIQIEIPAFEMTLAEIEVKEPYHVVWKKQGTFRHFAKNSFKTHRSYSMASNPETDKLLRFNIRLELPPLGMNYSSGIGSSYLFNLNEGDEVKAMGPFGDFHVKKSGREMIYVGGGAGMAPLRSHIAYLTETAGNNEKISYWYGARNLKELFYHDYFQELSHQNSKFSFQVALSEPDPEDNWNGLPKGYIHEILEKEYLAAHPNPKAVDYYLCGPPVMIQATLRMLNNYGVPNDQIAYDEF